VTDKLRLAALEIFRVALADMDAARAVRDFVMRDGERLQIANAEYGLHGAREVYVVALGKAAAGMSEAIDARLADRIAAGVISAPAAMHPTLSASWQIFAGGHPVPNEASLAAGRAALELLRGANHARALVIFLVSGGGSAMMEAPLDPDVTLDDLRAANELFVTCGATIDEINFLRRQFSAVKGGRLAQAATRARQATLIISDVNLFNGSVASSPSITPPEGKHDIAKLLRDYDFGATTARIHTPRARRSKR
jgi:hydroxypyruvate reductase